MKKAFSVFLLFAYLFSATDFKELLKVNVLIEHFYETRQIDKSVTFCEYLVMHYVTDDANNKDNDRDMQLPFRAQDKWVANGSFVYVGNEPLHFSFKPLTIKDKSLRTTENSFIYTSHKGFVWRPPQLS